MWLYVYLPKQKTFYIFTPMLKLIVNSDLHFQRGSIREDKVNHLATIQRINQSEGVDAVICAGDLTNNGFDGKALLCWRYGGTEDQVTPLKEFVDALGAPTYLCEGNHDQYVPWPYLHKGVRDLVVRRHGGRTYAWSLQKSGINYRFICLGVYPDKNARKFLLRELCAHSDNIVIYFHYNLEGQYSDWWSDDEKKRFLAILEPYRARIRLIIVGHRHENYNAIWNGYNVVSGAGSNVLMCTVDPSNNFTVAVREF